MTAIDEREPVVPRDTWCDRCGRTIYDGSLRPQPDARMWLCGACRTRQQERSAEAGTDELEPEWRSVGYRTSLEVWQAEGR